MRPRKAMRTPKPWPRYSALRHPTMLARGTSATAASTAAPTPTRPRKGVRHRGEGSSGPSPLPSPRTSRTLFARMAFPDRTTLSCDLFHATLTPRSHGSRGQFGEVRPMIVEVNRGGATDDGRRISGVLARPLPYGSPRHRTRRRQATFGPDLVRSGRRRTRIYYRREHGQGAQHAPRSPRRPLHR